ncbi:TIGR03986 family type III CRISPR-associated RAMP protein [Schwartzia succinivorans]|jgi:CRISPR-associated protein (TIGR03986 family)|uniref:CRISPR-associated protein n=1 Tax=Schwartzia succinivorans DSM 10502 TaxID=1123243 RepID=A0A1M4ZA71_9FIRM|nr:TIGR03986 family CRISPR-associated RAMP protein [Schwartzia succinivorans]SHF14875.1 CRISPR-associated protein [Schwartzia succinivorans DSM 10502]
MAGLEDLGALWEDKYGKEIEEAKPEATATAPYNFIPLPNSILPAELDDYRKKIFSGNKEERAAFKEFILNKGKNSGYLKLDFETKTPLFIGGNETNGEESFAVGDDTILPGSSIRGMVKNVFKILTCGAMRPKEDITPRHLYYRCLMANDAPCNVGLCNHYKEKMTSTDSEGSVRKNAKPGFLVKLRGDYFIYPMREGKIHSILIKDYQDEYSSTIRKSHVEWDNDKAICVTAVLDEEGLKTKEEIDAFIEETPADERSALGKQYFKYFIFSEIDKSEAHRIQVPDEVIEEYKGDKNRRGVNLLSDKKADTNIKRKRDARKVLDVEGIESIVPCFYIENNGRVSAFGHGQSFRIAYDSSVTDAVPRQLQESTIDFADAVFGLSDEKASWASRVHFDDAVPEGDVKKSDEADYSHVLVQPNPTSFQLYLKQDDDKQLMHWDSEGATIRGYKFYWHTKNGDGTSWKANEYEQKLGGKVLHKIRPILAGNRFTGKIHFHNLSDVELGALLRVFSLASDKNKEDIAFKLGQGKSIGLGSIHVDATKLYLEDKKVAKVLFDEHGWVNSSAEKDMGPFIKSFESYVREKKLTASYEAVLNGLRMAMDYAATELPDMKAATELLKSTYKLRRNGRISVSPNGKFKNRNILPDMKTVLSRAGKRNR